MEIGDLDSVLKYLCEHKSESKSTSDIDNDLFEGKRHDEVLIMIKKLVKDEYSIGISGGPHSTFYGYKITFDGFVFSETGGYKQMVKSKNAENTRLEKLEIEQRANQMWMTLLTAILSFVGLATLAYYAIDIYLRVFR